MNHAVVCDTYTTVSGGRRADSSRSEGFTEGRHRWNTVSSDMYNFVILRAKMETSASRDIGSPKNPGRALKYLGDSLSERFGWP